MEKRKIPNEAINAAAQWWANRVSGKVTHDNGDDSFGSVFAGLLADQGVKKVNAEQAQAFKNKLVIQLSQKAGEGRTALFLRCDYKPDPTLANCALAADISLDNFPWKVSMRIEETEVTVSDGYGRPWVKIWPARHKEDDEEGAA